MKYMTFALVVLLLPQASLAGNDVCIHLNGGADEVYIGQWNTMEIWIENDNPLSGMQLSFEIAWHPSIYITWYMSYGNYPPIQDHGRAVNAFDLVFVVDEDFDDVSADHITLGGASMVYDLPAGPLELCYSLSFWAYATAGVSGGFCVSPFDYNTSPPTDWAFAGPTYLLPDFCGYPIADMDNPVAPPTCFDLVPPVRGDCDGNGVGGTVADFVYLTEYLFTDGPPPPDPDACDCDNYPGVNFGDIWHLVKHVEDPSYLLYDSPGSDYMMVTPPVKFLVVGLPDGETNTEAAIMSKEFRSGADTIAIECMLLVLSYLADAGEADLNCTGIDFTGSAATNLTGNFDNDSKTLWIWNTLTPVMNVSDHWELVATAHFELDPSGSSGDGVELVASALEARRPIVLLKAGFLDTDPLGTRVGYAAFAPADPSTIPYIGDADCSGGVDIDDVVYIINYIFAGGTPPGDPDGDGIPDC